MSFAKTLKVVVPGTVFALSLAAAGLAAADTGRADGLGQYTSQKQESFQAAPAAQARNLTGEQVKSAQTTPDRSDELGLVIASKNVVTAQSNTALAASKHTGSNHSGQ